MLEYIYYCLSHPPTLQNMPSDGLVYVEPYLRRQYVRNIDHLIWGVAAYDRPLSPFELDRYKLIREEV